MEIPRLGNGKLLVMQAQDSTGKIINNDGSLYNTKGDDYYHIMDSLKDARKFALKKMKTGLVEVIIYDDKGVFIEIHRPVN